jgi:Ni,Fe-hydrogenase maturation factor
MGALPPRLAIVGCQPARTDEPGEGLSPPVERAVDTAATKVREIVASWVGEGAGARV